MNPYFNKYYSLAAGGAVIDIGCGVGSTLEDYKKSLAAAGKPEIIFFDKAKSMITGRTIATHYGDFHQLPFPAETFTYVYSRHSIEHARYPDKALREWCRVLKTGSGILHLEWPGYLEHRDPEVWRPILDQMQALVAAGDLEAYDKAGHDRNWLSRDPAGNLFLDGHYNVLGLEEMIKLLPPGMEVLETTTVGETTIIAKKRTNEGDYNDH